MKQPNDPDFSGKSREMRKQELKQKRRQQVRRQKIVLAGAGILLLGGIVTTTILISNHQKTASRQAQLKAEIKEKQEAQPLKQQEPENNTIHFVAVGDNLIHQGIYESADTTQAVWNYDHLYEHVRDTVSSEDLAASHGIHSETTEPFTLDFLQEQYKKVLTQNYQILG